MIKQFESKADIEEGGVIVDFFADWCRPCQHLVPVLERYDASNGSNVNIVKINIEDYPDVAKEFEVRSIPTLLFIKDGEILSKHVGTLSEFDLITKAKELI